MGKQPQLKSEIVTYLQVKVQDLDNFLKKTFGKKVADSVMIAENWRNDTSHTYEIDGQPDSIDLEEYQLFKQTGEWPGVVSVLQGLAEEGKIQTGDYLIEVCY